MKILLLSYNFAPQIGGIETVSEALAREFVAFGHEVVVVTNTPAGPTPDAFPFQVVRRPGFLSLLRLTRWCDIFFQNNPSLQLLYPLLFVRRPTVVAHHMWLTRADGSVGWQDRVKKWHAQLAAPLSVSQAIARTLPVRSEVVGNPYRDDLFRLLPGRERTDSLVFLGRLVSDKGADLLLDALISLRASGLAIPTTLIGGGPERAALERQAREGGILDQLHFAGVLTGEALVEELNRHRIMVVPSRLPEPYGVVALEGIACGCAVVASEEGGLREAVGPCGLFFPNGDAAALARTLRRALADRDFQALASAEAPAHLACRSARAVAAQYLYLFKRALLEAGLPLPPSTGVSDP
ncbi:MAG: glycosyltransferase family 4 protein [Verrucomicrobia bacterium]|nr:glycosyltransferase family 4 protein [Verrucomicrobiota bacterium]